MPEEVKEDGDELPSSKGKKLEMKSDWRMLEASKQEKKKDKDD